MSLTRNWSKTRSPSWPHNGPLSILVNNAGVSHIGTVESTTEADFDRVFRVNVKGYYNCMQAAVASMKARAAA